MHNCRILKSVLFLAAAAWLPLPAQSPANDTASANTGESVKQAPVVIPLRHLILSDTAPKVLALKATIGDGAPFVQAEEVALLKTKDFAFEMSKYAGQAISLELVNIICQDIKTYLQKRDLLIVNFEVPSQVVATGELRIAVKVGRYKDVIFRGNRWFSKGLIESKLGIHPGEEIRLSVLEEAINWANTNPFRQIKVLINDADGKGTNTPDLIVQVNEAVPVRFMGSYDDTGSKVIGRAHYTAGVQFGNLWGLDHQGSYQFTTTDYRKLYEVHSMDYRIPLPWRHYLHCTAAHSEINPSFGGGWFNQKATSSFASMRYLMPYEKGPITLEFALGLEFKQSNNDLEFGGVSVMASKHDIFQISSALTAVRKDSMGAWVAIGGLTLSPGNVNHKNSDAIFGAARYGADPRYAIGTFQLQRITRLPADFQLFSRGQAQVSTSNLVGMEQMTLGGTGSVRGYDDRLFAGDNGYLISHELQSPILSRVLPKSTKTTPPLNARLVAFWDFGRVFYKERTANDIELDSLMGAGLGVRANIGSYFNLTADYGWQLKKTSYEQPTNSRWHVRISMAY